MPPSANPSGLRAASAGVACPPPLAPTGLEPDLRTITEMPDPDGVWDETRAGEVVAWHLGDRAFSLSRFPHGWHVTDRDASRAHWGGWLVVTDDGRLLRFGRAVVIAQRDQALAEFPTWRSRALDVTPPEFE